MLFSRVSRSALAACLLSTALAACSCGDGGEDDAGMGRDAGPRVDAGPVDAGAPVDGGDEDDAGMVDSGGGGVECGSGECAPFQYCDSGTCRDYPACRGDMTCDRPGDVCHNRRCVPSEVDVDGDGFPAGEDCDETDPDVNPGATEICNLVDDDCNDMVDDGDPAALCESNPGGGECSEGSCGCDPGFFDLDRSIDGCECEAMPGLDAGQTCDAAIDIGNIPDNGQVETTAGNVMPDDRDVWYRFRGVDGADTTCDNYHVRVRFSMNPDDTFELAVFRGSCGAMVECGEATEPLVDYEWATDFRATVDGRLAGECPCSNAINPGVNVTQCSDDSADYFVRVRRRAGSTLSCSAYVLEISNGLYDTP